jgi:hypothetical protein
MRIKRPELAGHVGLAVLAPGIDNDARRAIIHRKQATHERRPKKSATSSHKY